MNDITDSASGHKMRLCGVQVSDPIDEEVLQ